MPSIPEVSGRRLASVKRHRRWPARAGAASLAAAAILWAGALPAMGQQDLTTGTPAETTALKPQSVHPLVGPGLVGRLIQLTGHKLQEAELSGPQPRLVVDAGGFVYGIDFYQCIAPAPPMASPAADPVAAATGGDAGNASAQPAVADPAAAAMAQASPQCASLRFSTAFDMPAGMAPSAANAWNRDRRFGRLWLDREGDPHLEMDVSLAAGVTTAHLVDVLDWWALVMNDFLSHIRAPETAAGPVTGQKR